MTILILLTIVAAFVVMRLNRKGVAWAKPVSTGLAFAVFFMVLIRMFTVGTGNNVKKSIAQDLTYQTAVGTYLGESLAKRHPNARVVILENMLAIAPSHKSMVKNLSSALKSGGLQVEVQRVDQTGKLLSPDEVKAWREPDEEYVFYGIKAAKFYAMLDALKDRADLVVSTLEFPTGFSASGLPRKGAGPGLVMLYPGPLNFSVALRDSCMDTVVLVRNSPQAWDIKAGVPRGTEAAFNNRYLLVTADNPDAVNAQDTLFEDAEPNADL